MEQEISVKAYCISDSTGITAEALGRSIMTQFSNVHFDVVIRRFINSTDLAKKFVEEINTVAEKEKIKPLIFSTIIDSSINAEIRKANAEIIDFFEPFLNRVGTHIHTTPQFKPGATHSLFNYDAYMQRIDAVDFALVHDDGQNIKKLDQADVILVGISRTGKTPTSLYLSMHYGLRAANYPITEDDIEAMKLPKTLEGYKHKLFGLTTTRETLREIREKRRPGSRYASIQQCDYEIRQTEILFKKNNIPFLNTVTISVEEISAKILNILGLNSKVNQNLP